MDEKAWTISHCSGVSDYLLIFVVLSLLPPSYHSVPCFKSPKSASLIMTKKRKSGQQLERPQFDFKVAEITHEPTDNNELETEIECPSCQNIMTLSTYGSPYYSCNDCNFCLYF